MASNFTSDLDSSLRNERNVNYPKQTWYLLGGFIGLLCLFHIGSTIGIWLRKRRIPSLEQNVKDEKTDSTEEDPSNSSSNRAISLRRIPIALVNTFRIIAFRISFRTGGGSVVNFAEISVAAGYIIALFTWEFINCRSLTTGVTLDVNYWSDRAANIVAIQFPLIVALAGKNNIVSLVTGISYEKINIFHRVAARVCLVLVWVHFWGRINIGLVDPESIAEPWVRTGIATATAYTLLVLISLRPIRIKFYEFFFFSHFLLVLLIVIGAYYHIRLSQGYGPYLIPTFVLWGLDRTIRFIRVVWNQSRFPKETPLYATAELLSPTMVRLTLRRKITWRPGQSALLTMPGVSIIPFQAHPFTIASIPQDEEGSSKATLNEGNELVFYVGTKEGFTRRLRDLVRCGSGDKGIPLSVYVDGPYGSPPDLNAFKTVILIAGGSGISYTLPLLQDIIRKAKQGKSLCRSILFIWAVPHYESLSWVAKAIHNALESAPSSLKFCFQLHVTRDQDPASDSERDVLDDTMLKHDCIRIASGRPNVRAKLEEELLDAQGPVSVDVAGPSELAIDVKEALQFDVAGPRAILKGGPDVTLHVETYCIA